MEKKPVYAFAKWQVEEGQLNNVLQLLTEVAKETSKEEGNLFYQIHQSNSDLNTIVLYEGYVDEDAVAVHRSSSHFQDLLVKQIVPLLVSREVVLASRLN
ncbi:putative quinol monooxygenase [Runella sp. MFBS21]|uniref:putative quinol monooxygenase n=1 Tax=Runella sp. MFBS21 TaxID=3034018 RepID=UPI0023F964DD|nr:putative quinol monooxygenase [Runella sp. MFBS21]MDF7822219.1 putative quinol monooxygenase [Runella sp. MFBS21]